MECSILQYVPPSDCYLPSIRINNQPLFLSDCLKQKSLLPKAQLTHVQKSMELFRDTKSQKVPGI